MQNNPHKAECCFTQEVHRVRQGAMCFQLRHCETLGNYYISAPHLTYGHDSFPTWKQCHEDSKSKCRRRERSFEQCLVQGKCPTNTGSCQGQFECTLPSR